MKEALGGVRADAAIMRSPSFSREGESRTMTNSSFAVERNLRQRLSCRVREES